MIYILVSLLVLAADQLIKQYIVTHLKEGENRYCLHGHLRLTRYHNTGAVLSKLSGHVNAIRNCTAVLIGLLVWMWARMLKKEESRAALLGGSLMIGGALGNFVDRCCRKYVVDYAGIQMRFKRLSALVFNLADVILMVGGVLVSLFRKSE